MAAKTKAKKKKKKSKAASTGSKPAAGPANQKRPPPDTEGRIDALAKVFAALGARQPEKWARTHVEHGSDELGRFVLLRALWLRTVEPGRLLGTAQTDVEVGAAVDRLLKTANLADLDALIRYAQRTALDDVCRVLDDPAVNDDGIRWAVFRVDARGMPLWTLEGLRAGLDDSEPR